MQSYSIALVPEAGGVSPSELLRVSAALQKQISGQFGPVWELRASVDAFAELEDVPAGYRPIVLSPVERAGVTPGIHLDENGQPYARVLLAPGWSIAASRACMEMLVNPFGQRTFGAPSPRSDQGPAEVLVEACAAFGDAPRAYAVNDVPVSDFCTPAYYEAPALRANDRYSFRGGAFSAPLQLLRGGRLAWFDAISNSWWLRTFHEEHPSDLSLGSLRPSGRSLRALIMAHAPSHALAVIHHEPLDARVGLSWLREQASLASRARAQHLRALLDGALAATDDPVFNAPVELPASALASPSFGRLRAVQPAARSHTREREPTQGFEHELREVVASEIDAAFDDAPLASEAAQAAAKRAKSSSVADADAATRPSVPPPLPPARPSSIAPVAMLDNARKSEGSRLGVMLIGAAAVALAVAGWMRGGDAKSSTQAATPATSQPAAATTASTTPNLGAPPPVANVAAREPDNNASASQPAAPAQPTAAGQERAPLKPATPAPERSVAKTEASLKASDAREPASEKHHTRQRASKEASPTTPPDNAPPKAQPVAAIESLFDTRR